MTGSATEVEIGGRTFTLSKITLGTLRHDVASRDAVAALATESRALAASGTVPSVEQLELMITIVYASARQTAPALTRDELSAAFDDEPFDTGFLRLAECVGLAMYARALRPGGAGQGEAPSPSSSTSLDSTGSSPQQPDTDTPTSTS